MSERFKISLSGMWLFVCVFTLLIPVFLPSFAGSANPASNVVGTATASMFILGLIQWFWIVPRIWRNSPTGADSAASLLPGRLF